VLLPLISFESGRKHKLNLLGSQLHCTSKWRSGSILEGKVVHSTRFSGCAVGLRLLTFSVISTSTAC
jgi:hypothetical protein